MKDEKELIWLITLAQSKFCPKFMKKPDMGCKKDFERLLGAPENDKDFLGWLKELIEKKVLILAGQIQRGSSFSKNVDAYTIDFGKLMDLLRKNSLYDDLWKFFDSRSTAGVSY